MSLKLKKPEEIIKHLKDEKVPFVDLRFTDPRGKWQHLTMCSDFIDEDAFKNVRLKKYNQETKPLVKYYNEKKLLKSLDGDSTPEEISKKIIEIIKNTK